MTIGPMQDRQEPQYPGGGRGVYRLAKAILIISVLLWPAHAFANCIGYSGPGGPCYTGPGGGLYTGPGGGAYTGPGGGAYSGPGGPCYSGPGSINPDPWNRPSPHC